MSTPLAPWQQRIHDRLVAALAAGQLGHALLLVGAPAMGKRDVAQRLVQRFLCTQPRPDGAACGACRSCHLQAVGTHPDLKDVTFEPNDKGDKLRSMLVVDQIRRLGEWFALTPQMGGAQVALIHPAEAMNDNASNALLKTLEEPSRDRYLVLVSDDIGRLSATIRSRCQIVEFRLPARAEAEAWLRARGHAEPGPALDAARGHPGLAGAWLADGSLAVRGEVLAALNAVAGGRRSPLETATAWFGDERTALRLRFAADLARDAAAHRLAAAPAPGLTLPADFQKLGHWFDRINQLHDQLAIPVLRHDLVLAGLLLEWRGLCYDSTRGERR